MIEIALQHGTHVLHPYTDECKEALKKYKHNQILRAKIYGVEKERSYKQLNTYWACAGFVAEQVSDHLNITTRGGVDFETKVQSAQENPAIIKRFKEVGGITYMEPISIAIPNMNHIEACKYFDIAFKVMGNLVNMTAEELIRETQARMK